MVAARAARSRRISAPSTAPHLYACTPDLGCTFGGAPLTLTVSGDVTSVSVNGIPCTSVVQIGATVMCYAPALANGTYDVAVTGPGGTDTLEAAYRAWHPTEEYATARLFQSDQNVTHAGAVVRARTGRLATGILDVAIDGAEMLTLPSGRIILVAGWHTAFWDAEDGDGDVTNGIRYSDDDGATFAELLAREGLPPTSGAGARFYPGHSMPCFLHTVDGDLYVYVIGSDANSPSRDGGVWRALASALDVGGDPVDAFVRISTTAPTIDTSLIMFASFNGVIYLGGGQSNLGDKDTVKKTMWKSTDHGVTWTAMTDGPWAARSGARFVVFNGAMLLVSGGRYTTIGDDRDYFTDVWSMSTSEVWTELTSDWGFAGRSYTQAVVFQERLWVICGYTLVNDSGAGLTDVLSTADGVTWAEIPDVSVSWYPTHAIAATVTSDGTAIVMSQGIANESIYRLEKVAGSLVSVWGDTGDDALSLEQSTDAAKLVRLANDFVAQPGIVGTGAQFMALASGYDRGISGGVLEEWVIGKKLLDMQQNDNGNIPITPLVSCAGDQAYNQFGMNGGELTYADLTAGLKEKRSSGALLADGVPRLLGVEHRYVGPSFASTVKLLVNTAQIGATDTTLLFTDLYTGWDGIGKCYGSPFTPPTFSFGAVLVLKTSAPSSSDFRARLRKWAGKWGVAQA